MIQNLYKLCLLLLLGLPLLTQTMFAQSVTTATLKGLVTGVGKDATVEGEVLLGATVIAIHTPSGTNYGSLTQLNGVYIIPNMRVGGPYKITISYIGYQDAVYENIFLSLGNTTNLNVKLVEDATQLSEVIITSNRNDVFNSDRTGAATNISKEKMNSLPTVNRNINDFTRLTPQSNGTSFGGRDNRFNNYTIDGNIYNNNFGLGSGQFAGSNPISLDAIEEVQVNLAPYDVRQGGFTGANVNAITKSGTNSFEGSVYRYFRNDQLIGDKVEETRLVVNNSRNIITGMRLGGPIIKDKVFFFFSYEKEVEDVPSFTKVAARDGKIPDGLTVSRVTATRLDSVRSIMKEKYDYETGGYENYQFASESQRINARIDWNINQNHKLAVRFNNYDAFRDETINGNSIRYLPTTARITTSNRFGIEAMNFQNSNLTINTNVKSYVAELNSSFGNNIANSLNVGLTSIQDPKRGIPGGQDFPFIEVLEPDAGGNLLYYMSLGNELFSVGNLLENSIFNITNNTTLFLGDHTVTGGVNFESMTFDNAFNPNFNGFYRYNSYDKFKRAVLEGDTTVYPDAFAQGYAFDGSNTPPTDNTRFSQFGIYAQDEWQLNSQLKLTAGFRLDMPFYPVNLPTNPTLDALNKKFANPLLEGDSIRPDVSTLPKVKPLFSPRVGFNYDLLGDRTLQLRGGTGVFSGRIPFVWISNQVNGNGVLRGGIGLVGAGVASDSIYFKSDINAYRPHPDSLTAQLSSELNITDENFKLPQTWRSNIALDAKLPFDITVGIEFIYSKDVSTPIAVNPVLAAANDTLAGPDKRVIWTDLDGAGPGVAPYSKDANFGNVFYLTNADKQGDYYSITFSLSKNFENGLSITGAYTKSRARDYGLDGGSQAISLWSTVVSEDRNNPDISYTRFDQPNRVIGVVSYKILENTTMSLFYEGGEAGRFSYTYSGNFGDGSQRLIYVPKDHTEINFQEYTVSGNVFTEEMQSEAFFKYVEQDEYLNSMKGKITERNGVKLPWRNRFDFRLAQDIPVTKNGQNRLQLTVDILNIGNLINSEWGMTKTTYQRNLLAYRGINAEGEPIYRMNLVTGTTALPTETFRPQVDFGQTWRGQIGIRYIFGN